MKLFLAIFISTFVFSIHSNAERGNGPCKQDAEKFCKDVKPGGGNIRKCLKEHKDELSAECKAKHEKLKERYTNFREACQEDIKTHCGDIKPGKRQLIKCLKEKEASLTAACKEAIERKRK